MKVQGMRILDKENKVVSVDLSDILREIWNGDLLYWSILSLEATGHLGEGKSMPVFEKQIYDSEKGVFIDWSDLNALSKKFHQVIDIIIIGCKNQNMLHRYINDREMYKTCDIAIEMIDSSYWEVFTKDQSLLARLKAKFKETKFLEPNFEK